MFLVIIHYIQSLKENFILISTCDKLTEGMILKIVCLDRIDIIIITNDKPNDTARVII